MLIMDVPVEGASNHQYNLSNELSNTEDAGTMESRQLGAIDQEPPTEAEPVPIKRESGAAINGLAEKRREIKLNCNLCEDIFTSINGLSVHVKTHPEVVLFELQLLDRGTSERDGIENSTPTDEIDAESTEATEHSTNLPQFQDSQASSKGRPKRTIKKSKFLDDDYSTFIPGKLPRKERRSKRKKGTSPTSHRSKRTSALSDLTLDRVIKTEPGLKENAEEKSDDIEKVCDGTSDRYSHEKKRTRNFKFKCDKCEKAFNSNYYLQQHVNMHDGIKPHECSKCSKTFASKQKWKLHENKCDPSQPKPIPKYLQTPKETPCHFCGKMFLRADSLKSHIAVQHTEGGRTRYECDRCGRKFSQKGALRVHQKNPRACLRDILNDRAPGLPFVDEVLTESDNKTDLAKSILDEVNSLMEKPFKCQDCDTACATTDGLEMHRRKHTDKYPFRCDECGKGFNSNVTLRGHVNKHKGHKPHICVKCNRGFYHVSNLQRHFRYCNPEKQEQKTKKKMEEKEHICAFCGKLLQTTGGLLLHMNKHTGQFPFKCKICSKGYNSNMLLKAHVDSHMNVKGFVCQHCGKNFRHKSNLNRHLSYCDPEKQAADGTERFSCDLCDKTYLRKESLTEHKIAKHSSVTFDCTECGKVYDSRGSLFWHRTKSLCAKRISHAEVNPRRKKIKQEQPQQMVEKTSKPLAQQHQFQQRQESQLQQQEIQLQQQQEHQLQQHQKQQLQQQESLLQQQLQEPLLQQHQVPQLQQQQQPQLQQQQQPQLQQQQQPQLQQQQQQEQQLQQQQEPQSQHQEPQLHQHPEPRPEQVPHTRHSQFQHVPNEVVMQFPTVSQVVLPAPEHVFNPHQPHEQQPQEQHIALPIGNGAIPVEAAENISSLPGLETNRTSLDLESSNKSLITLVSYQNEGQKTYFNFS